MQLKNKSFLNLDPRTKILLIILANVLIFTFGNNIFMHITTAFGVILMILCGKNKQAINFTIFCLSIYGITYLMNFVPRAIAIIWSTAVLPIVLFMPLYAFSYLLFTTTSISQMVTALQKMKVPSAIITPLLVMFRFFPSIKQELFAIRNAMKLKGVSKNPLKLIEYVYVPLLFNCVKIGEDLNISGVTRGLGLYKTTTRTIDTKLSLFDLFSVLTMIILICFRKGIIPWNI